MVIRPLIPELQEKAKNELGEEPSRIAEDLNTIREWLLTQPHLKCRTDDQWLISFLRSCKFNLEKTKTKLDNFYRIRTLVPEFFENRDPFQPEIQEYLKAGLFLPLPKTTEASGPRIIYIHFTGISDLKINHLDLFKVYSMLLDVLILEDDNFTVAGVIGLNDLEEFPFRYILQLTPNFLRKIVSCVQHCYPLRIKGSHYFNAPLGFETIFYLAKSFMSSKLKSKFFVHGKKKSKNLDHIIEKKYLPQQLGGTNGCMDELTEYWKSKIESYRDWFLEDDNYRSIENLRSEKSTFANLLSMFGSFNPFHENSAK